MGDTNGKDPDREIVHLHRSGRRDESLRLFAKRYETRLLSVARRLLGDQDDALDALQEILIQVDKSLPKFRAESSLYTWAFRLATNVSLTAARARSNHRVRLDETFARAADNADVMCRTRFRQHLVEQALLKLPESQRAVVVLCDLEEMSAPVAADVLGIGANAVKSRLHRGRARLKRIVDDEFQALGLEVDGLHTLECTARYLTQVDAIL
jgi:RNA polymerase sigma-70 factor, ECF subfamily